MGQTVAYEINIFDLLIHLLSENNIKLPKEKLFKLSYNTNLSLKSQLEYLLRLHRTFPTVFKKSDYILNYKPNIADVLKLKAKGISFYKSKNGELALDSIEFNLVNLQLQIILLYIEYFQRSKEIIESKFQFLYQFKHWLLSTFSIRSFINSSIKSKTKIWLEENLGNKFSYGEMVDFSDRLYDQYKHTNISTSSFFNLFSAFGYYVEEIASTAFDYYMSSRNTNESWQKAIVNFLTDSMNLDEEISNEISKFYFLNN